MSVNLGSRQIGAGWPCYIVAEIGINHNGDLDLAKQMMDAAADAGVDAVKFQNYHTAQFLTGRALTYEYISQGKVVVEPQYDMFQRCELTREILGELKSHADQRGVGFHSTPMDEEGVRDLVKIGVPLLKNGSDCLTHLPLLRFMANTGLPLVISTGMGTLAEIDEAVRAVRDAGNDHLVLLHCTSAYPTPPDEVHLRKIPTLAAAFGCPVGFSDHTDGVTAAIGAVALGACWIEKHFTLDKNLPGPDHPFSADPAEMQALVQAVRTVEAALGQSAIGPTSTERKVRGDYRLSCVAASNLPVGHRLTAQDIAFSRPATGLPPDMAEQINGKRLIRPVTHGHFFVREDFRE